MVQKQERHCFFCVNQTKAVSYRNTGVLQRFLASSGKIRAKKKTGLCSKHQRKMTRAVKTARSASLLPFVQA